MIADTLAALVAALEAQSLRVAVRSGDITPPVVYLQIGTVSDAGGPLSGGIVTTFYVYYIPVRGVDNLAADAAYLDAMYDALRPIAAADMVTTRTSVTVTNDTWPCYRADVACLALDLSEVS